MRWLRHRISGNTLLTSFWQGQRLLLQAAWLVLVARLLGPGELGAFVGLIGLATTLGGISGLGFGLVMFRDTVREPSSFGDRLRATLLVTIASGAGFGLLFVVIGPPLTASDPALLVLAAIGVSEVVALPVTSAASFAFAAHERMGWSAGLPALQALGRLLAAGSVWLGGAPTLTHLAIAHAIGTTAAAALALAAVMLLLRPASGRLILRKGDFRDGAAFCFSWAGTNALNSLDKANVLRWGGKEISGHYSVAYRIAAIFAMPIEALTTSATPRLFRSSHAGQSEHRFIGRLLAIALGYGLLAGGSLWLAAPFAATLFGHGYEEAADAGRVMALFVPLYGLRVLGANILLAHGKTVRLVVMQVTGVVAMIAAGAFLIPAFGLRGSVYTIISIETLLGALIWGSLATGGAALRWPGNAEPDNPSIHLDRT